MTWGEYGKPLAWDAEIEECVNLYALLKTFPNCASGGPLHIITDDDNLDDHWLQDEPDRYNKRVFTKPAGWTVTDEIEWPPEVIAICQRILELLREMPEAHRYAVNAWHWGSAQEFLDNHPRAKKDTP
jgi:hypothetical protein